MAGRKRKLTPEQEDEARSLYVPPAERWTLARLAKRYGISTNSMHNILGYRRRQFKAKCQRAGIPFQEQAP